MSKGLVSYLINEIVYSQLQPVVNKRTMLKKVKCGYTKPEQFKRCEPHLFNEGQDEPIWFSDVTPDVLWPIDISLVFNRKMLVKDPVSDSDLVFYNVRTVSLKEARPDAKLFSSKMICVSRGDRWGTELFITSYLYAFIGGKWKLASIPDLKGEYGQGQLNHIDLDVEFRFEHIISVAFAAAFRQRYSWLVEIGRKNTPSFIFDTDSNGIKSLFADREKNDETNRRLPLLNWVNNHWRKNSKSENIEHFVRDNLRGNTIFEWCGFGVKIIPSQYDIEKENHYINHRVEMKNDMSDVRIV